MGIKSNEAYDTVRNACNYVWNYISSFLLLLFSCSRFVFTSSHRRPNAHRLYSFIPFPFRRLFSCALCWILFAVVVRRNSSSQCNHTNCACARASQHTKWVSCLQLESFPIISCSKQIFISAKQGTAMELNRKELKTNSGWLGHLANHYYLHLN